MPPSLLRPSRLTLGVLALLAGTAPRAQTPTPVDDPSALPTVRATAGREVKRDELPAALPGGQVARGARLGNLGNVDVLTTPFSIKAFTAELIKAQGARSVDDVVLNDASVRVSLSPGFVLDQSSVRGFQLNGGAYTLDGLPGLVGYNRIPVQNFERVEILKGPSSAVGGASVSGTAVGGSINLVTKRATAVPVASVSAGVTSDSVLATHVDLGRRFGASNEWGLRLNVYAEDGKMASGTDRKNTVPQLALDYAGDRLRATLDVSTIDYRNRRPGVNHSLGVGQTLPAAPQGGRSANPSVAQQALDAHWAVLGAEFDLLPLLTAYAKTGRYHEDSVDSFVPTVGALNSDGTFPISRYVYNSWKTRQDSHELGLRGSFNTGGVKHQVSLSALRFRTLYTSASGSQSTTISPATAIGNLYTDYAVPASYVNVVPALGPYIGARVVQDGLGVSDNLTALDDRLNLVLGLRHQRIRQGALAPAVPYNAERNTPTAGASYKLAENWAVYGNYAEQLSQGAVAPTGTTNAGTSLAPYLGKQHELGVKWNAGTYGVTLAYFNIQQASGITDPVDNTFKAAGQQRNRGLELDTFGQLARGVRVLGGFTYIDAEQVNGQPTLVAGSAPPAYTNTNGKQAVGVSRINVNLGAEWDLPAVPGLTLTGRALHTGTAYVNLANTQQLPAWTRFDLGARYATRVGGKALTLRAGVNNVADKAYWQTGGRTLFVVAEPRTWRVSGTVDF